MIDRKRVYRRWITITGECDIVRYTLEECLRLNIGIFYAGKPGMCAWYGFGLKCSSKQINDLELSWGKKRLEYHMRQPQGAWDIPDQPLLTEDQIWDFMKTYTKK